MGTNDTTITTTIHPHIAVFAFPFASHPGNLFTFAGMLADSAPNITISFFSSSQSLASLSRTSHSDFIRLYPLDDGLVEGPQVNVMEQIGKFIKAMPGNLRAGIKEAEDTEGLKVTCVVSDAFLWTAGVVAEEMRLPWVPLWTCGPAGLLSHVYTNEIRQKLRFREQDERSITNKLDEPISFIPSLSALRVGDLPFGVVLGDVHSEFPELLHRAGANLHRATAVAINTFRGLSPEIDAEFDSKFKKSLPIGPVNLLRAPSKSEGTKDTDKCLAWLEHQSPASVAYVSFGTVLMPPQPEVEELAHGLEASGVPFLWSLKERARAWLPEGFLDRTIGRGLVVPWAPQEKVLRHKGVGVFVTHCGWNSIMESVAGGVPMALRPMAGEQKANARMVSHVWRFGVVLGEQGGVITRHEISGILNLVLREEEGRKMRERVTEFQKRATQAAETGGTSRENFKSLLKIVCSI